MSKTTLFTQLKGSLDDGSFKKLDTLRFVLAANANVFRLQFGQVQGSTFWTAKIYGNGYFTDQTGSENYGKTFVNTSTAGNLFLKNVSAGDVLEVSEQYSISRVWYYGSTELFTGEVDLSYMPNLTIIGLGYLQNNAWLEMDEVSETNPLMTQVQMVHSKSTGSVERIVENMLAAGRNDGNLILELSDTNVTLNNSVLTGALFVTFNSATSATVYTNNAGAAGTELASYSAGQWSYL